MPSVKPYQVVVLDSSSWVRIVRSKPKLQLLRREITTRRLRVYCSLYILAEVEQAFARKFTMTKRQAKAKVGIIKRLVDLAEPDVVNAVCRDPSDDVIIALAAIVQADYLITQDNDMLEICTYHDVQIINTPQFMAMLESARV